jgi:hypothetical protein
VIVVQSLPLADPGAPDLRSASRFLVRIAWRQRWAVLDGWYAALGQAWPSERVP